MIRESEDLPEAERPLINTQFCKGLDTIAPPRTEDAFGSEDKKGISPDRITFGPGIFFARALDIHHF